MPAPKKFKLFDSPPDGRKTMDFEEVDEIAIALIDNPGKWALLGTRENTQNRTTHAFLRRYGTAFVFKTYHNTDTGLLEIWGAYKGSED